MELGMLRPVVKDVVCVFRRGEYCPPVQDRYLFAMRTMKADN